MSAIRDVSLFSGRGGGGEGYQFFKQGSQKILTLPLNTNKKIVTLPQPLVKKIVTLPTFVVIFFKTLLPWIELPSQIQ